MNVRLNCIAQLREIRERKQRVLVIGLGISGIESAKLLARLGIATSTIERDSFENYKAKTKFNDRLAELNDVGVKTVFGIDGEKISDQLNDAGLCVLSPGVSQESAIVGALRRHGIPTIGELELGIELKGLPFVAVTGSNGKSTTVSLMQAIFESDGFDSTLCGNVGTPVVSSLGADALDVTPRTERALQVVEVSSYQLESCSVIKPKVACLLNISDNHLERHGSLERYLLCKSKLFENQDASDFAVLNVDDGRVAALAPKLVGQVMYFGRAGANTKGKLGAFFRYEPKTGEDVIEVNLPKRRREFLVHTTKLHGLHNRYNICTAVLATLLMGASDAAVEKAIQNFLPLEHRQELVANTGRFVIINDSKSTTVAASQAAILSALDTYPNRRLTLMLGGLVKAGSWEPVIKIVEANKSRLQLILFGKDRNILADHFEERGCRFESCSKLADATKFAIEHLQSDDVLLFTPGAASFDEFKDFEERGRFFKQQVSNYLGA